jgi:alginate O-acetyltransferase complex protein AlgI
MLFSSLIFLYLFLPITIISYYLLPNQFKNNLLLLASLIFFAWGGVSYTLILIVSIVFNYFFGIKIQNNLTSKKAYFWLLVGVIFNLLLLAVFKYTNFIIENLNQLSEWFNFTKIDQTNIILPIGISFYTFHSLSYLADIYRKKAEAQRNILKLALYICLFFQLVAGPIIRYSDIAHQLLKRKYSIENFSIGVERFIIGLGKKVLLANVFARVADEIFNSNLSELSAINAWLGLICYTLQIYLDFSAYSDMAIGLAKMFGFEFLENFNFPYIARSIKDFWRRWHISLSSFFRDYVYIPLGGNKVKISRIYINLFIVFFLTGFWHGASWNFVLWGLFHGVFIVIERIGFDNILKKTWRPLAHIYTLLVVMFAWVLFRVNTLEEGITYYQAMFNFQSNLGQNFIFNNYLNVEFLFAFCIAIFGSFGLYRFLKVKFDYFLNAEVHKYQFLKFSFLFISIMFYTAVFYLSTLYLTAGTYNPFIYYRF